MDVYPAYSKSPPTLGREPNYGGRDDTGRAGNDNYRRRSPGKVLPCICCYLVFVPNSQKQIVEVVPAVVDLVRLRSIAINLTDLLETITTDLGIETLNIVVAPLLKAPLIDTYQAKNRQRLWF